MKKPLYYQRYYAKIYENNYISGFLSLYPIWQLLSGFQKNKINNSILKEVNKEDKVLVLGISFDNLIERLCQKAKKIDVIDISYNQIDKNQEKYEYLYKNINFIYMDATAPINEKYDVVISNNILHEVPNITKSKIVDNALKSTKIKGKTIFVDYHQPSKYFVLKYFIRMFNRLYQPFAEKMWDKTIVTYAKEKLKYSWRKKTFCFGCFQKVVAQKKSAPTKN